MEDIVFVIGIVWLGSVVQSFIVCKFENSVKK
jgi:hypothetical protein